MSSSSPEERDQHTHDKQDACKAAETCRQSQPDPIRDIEDCLDEGTRSAARRDWDGLEIAVRAGGQVLSAPIVVAAAQFK